MKKKVSRPPRTRTTEDKTPPTLEERLCAYCNDRNISIDRAKHAGIVAVDDRPAKTMGYLRAGFVIPYSHPLKDELLETQRIRHFDPPVIDGKPRRFSQLKGTPVEAYFDPNVTNWPKVFKDPKIDLYIVEGEMKAIAMNQHDLITIALGGVHSFGSDSLTPLLRKIVWKGRRVFIVYDSDAATNENVMRAERKLAEVLS